VTEHSDQKERRSRAFLTHLEPEYDDVLLHLLDCGECRGIARALLGSPEIPSGEPSRAWTTELHGPDAATLKRLNRLVAASPSVRRELLASDEFQDLQSLTYARY
jgi:hypothetical protein